MKFNQMNQFAINGVFIILSMFCLLPFILLFIVSISDQNSVIYHGYSFFPEKLSMEAYEYLWGNIASIGRSYGITILITIIGTSVGLLVSCLVAYPLSRKDMPARRVLSFVVFFTLLFNGGLVPTYLVYTDIFNMKNTLWSLLIPYLLTNGFYILLIRSFFQTSIPVQIIESAYMDGAGEFRIFYKMVLPLSLPILATIGLFLAIHYWNDWFNGLIFLTDPKLYSMQNLLNRMLLDVQFLQNTDFGGYQSTGVNNIPLETVRMAIAVIGILPLICVYPFFQKYFSKGLTLGAVKG